MAVAPTSVVGVTGEAPLQEQFHKMKSKSSCLVDSVATLQTASLSTIQSSSPSPMNSEKLFQCHREFGNAACKCVPPCEFSGNAMGRR
ncbi:hypothetical protein MRX96_015930 [Rhipicephalus microplus]